MQGNERFSKKDFVKWIRASHDLFEIFEGRHDAYPHYFPLLDNPIAEQMGLKKHDNDKIDNEKYIIWMKMLKNWLENYKDVIQDLENKYGYSILKLVDEGFYTMCSMNLRNRINRLGIKNKI